MLILGLLTPWPLLFRASNPSLFFSLRAGLFETVCCIVDWYHFFSVWDSGNNVLRAKSLVVRRCKERVSFR